MADTEMVLASFPENARSGYEWACDEADELALALEDFSIATKADEAKVNELIGQVKAALGNIDHARRLLVDPLNAQVKQINDVWRRPKDVLEKLEVSAKRTLTIWLQAERERIAKEQAEARRLQEEAARKAAEAERQQQEALAKAEAAKNSKARDKALAEASAAGTAAAQASTQLMQARIAEPMEAPRGVKTDGATSGLVDRWTFRVVDKTKVPADFVVVSDVLVRKAIAEGARHIEGLEIYAEESLSTRLRR